MSSSIYGDGSFWFMKRQMFPNDFRDRGLANKVCPRKADGVLYRALNTVVGRLRSRGARGRYCVEKAFTIKDSPTANLGRLVPANGIMAGLYEETY